MTDVPATLLAQSFHPDVLVLTWLMFGGIPLVIGLLTIHLMARKIQDDTGKGLGLWATGLSAGLVGILAPAIWLTWSGYHETPLDFYLPAPTRFPEWQIAALAVTYFIPIIVLAVKMRRPFVGAFALAMGGGIGSSTAMIVDVAFIDTTSQEGIGVVLALVGVGLLTLMVGEMIGIPRGVRAGLKR
mgnify:FL=1